ncbi:MAG TPA: hypothetical protein VGF37_10520, partial [Chthoniobacterales bacterium]
MKQFLILKSINRKRTTRRRPARQATRWLSHQVVVDGKQGILQGIPGRQQQIDYAKISENRRIMNSMKMRAAVLAGPRQLIVTEIVPPEPKSDEVC